MYLEARTDGKGTWLSRESCKPACLRSSIVRASHGFTVDASFLDATKALLGTLARTPAVKRIPFFEVDGSQGRKDLM